MTRLVNWTAGAALALLGALTPFGADAGWRTTQVQDVHFASVETRTMALFLACRHGAFSVSLVAPQALPAFRDNAGPVASFRFGPGVPPQRFHTAPNEAAEGPHKVYRLALSHERAGPLIRALRRETKVVVTLTGGADAESARAHQAELSLAGSNRALTKIRQRCV